MITAEELADITTDAKNIIKNYPKDTISYSLALDLLKLLAEFERVNRLGTEVRMKKVQIAVRPYYSSIGEKYHMTSRLGFLTESGWCGPVQFVEVEVEE